jgi:hypothetical protein
MHENILADAHLLSDDALHSRLKQLALGEREATIEVVAHLAELDARRAHLGEGPGSVCAYCRDVLGYSEDAAWNRAATANVVRRYPAVLGWLADGTLNVTTVRMLRRVLTSENHLAVLTEARRRSKTEVELIVRRLEPKPDVPSTIRPVSGSTVAVQPTLLPPPESNRENPATNPHSTSAAHPPSSASAAPAAAPAPERRPVIAPLTPERYRLQFTVSKATHDKLRRLQSLLCREVRDGDPAAIFDKALDELLAAVEKLGTTAKPRPPRPSKSGSRNIPAHVRRAVWKRDEGRCAYEGGTGRCSEKRFLDWHHVIPFGHQGTGDGRQHLIAMPRPQRLRE